MEQPKWEIEYFDVEEQTEKVIKLKPRFLTPELRVKIIKFDAESQKIMNKIDEDGKAMPLIAEQVNKVNEMTREIEAYLDQNPNATDEELEFKRAELAMALKDGMTSEFVDSTTEMNLNIWTYSDKRVIEFFKLITNAYQISDKEKELYHSDIESTFWQNVNMMKITELNHFFRAQYLNRK